MASETQEVFAVLANRLGAWSLKSELEDLSFKTLNPEEYAGVAAAIAAHSPGNGAALSHHIEAVSEALRAAGLEVVDVSGRVKNVYGIWKKLKEGGRVEEVYDVQALRVVVPHKHDCYAALRVVESKWAAMPGRFKDYIRNRKANGYQSLHTTVRDASGRSLEVQIRTPKMHYIAEYGFAAHWRYKEKLDREDLWLDRLVQWKKWVATSKLGILDRKLRPSGSPGRDVALVELAAVLGLDTDEKPPPPQQQQQQEALSGLVAARSLRSVSVASEPCVSPFSRVCSTTSSVRSSSDGGLTARELQQQARAAASAERFVQRYGLQPVDDADLQLRDSTVLVNGPRGVRMVDVAAGSTLWQLFRSGVLPDGELRGCGVQLNGELVVGRERWQRVLQAGDHVELVELERSSREGWSPAEPYLARAPSTGLGEEGYGGLGGGLLVSGPRGQSIDLEKELTRAAFGEVAIAAAAVVG
jgi:ppGpp synthetase/RelA/SpoT-type nucleotidyltranferase